MSSVTSEQAIAAARSYADERRYAAWRAGTVHATRLLVGDRDCWKVVADDLPTAGEDNWLEQEFDGGQAYLIDSVTGGCVGIGLLNGYRMFDGSVDDR